MEVYFFLKYIRSISVSENSSGIEAPTGMVITIKLVQCSAEELALLLGIWAI